VLPALSCPSVFLQCYALLLLYFGQMNADEDCFIVLVTIASVTRCLTFNFTDLSLGTFIVACDIVIVI